MSIRSWLLAAALAWGAVAAPAIAQESADSYPSKPITIVLPYSAGGGQDLICRIIAQLLGDKLGQRILVENRPGAGSAVGTAYVAEQPADGYTLLFTTAQLISTNLTLKQPNYEISDFQPIGLVSESSDILVVPASLPVKSVADLIAYSKAHPGEVSYGSVGIASNVQIISAIFAREQGLDMVEVPFGGGSDVMKALLTGDIDVYFGAGVQDALAVSPDLRYLAIASKKRSVFLPDIPTFAELGYPDILDSIWSGLHARADTPAPIVEKLQAALHEVVNSPEAKEPMLAIGLEPFTGDVAEFKEMMAAKQAQVEAHIKTFGIEPQ